MSQNFSQRTNDTLIVFGTGVMLAASSSSLIIPALGAAKLQGASSWGAGGIVGACILLGGLLLLYIDRTVPHEHFVKGLAGPAALKLKCVWLFVFAISLQNLCEGLAIGAVISVSAGLLSLGAGHCRWRHAFCHQSRNYSRVARYGARAVCHGRLDAGIRHDDVAGYCTQLNEPYRVLLAQVEH